LSVSLYRVHLFLGIRLSVVGFSGTKKPVTEDPNPGKDVPNNGNETGKWEVEKGRTMKKMIYIESVRMLNNKALHIRMDGTVGIVSMRKPSFSQRMKERLQPLFALFFSKIP
jgi:hypothetical protein